MARQAAGKRAGRKAKPAPRRRLRPLRWLGRALLAVPALVILLTLVYALVNPPVTHTMIAEWRRLGAIERDWVPAEAMAPVLLRSVVAAEDANFCLHWGFDMAAIRTVIESGAERGASTISQQTVKNVFLWQGRSWLRKALEAAITPLAELVWSKRRMLEIYLNVAEFGEGVFGAEAAARHWYGVPAAELSATQAARLAVLLPNPKARDPGNLGAGLRRRAAQVESGAETIRVDGRAACFES